MAQIQDLETRHSPHRAMADVRNLRKPDPEFFKQPEVLIDRSEGDLVLRAVARVDAFSRNLDAFRFDRQYFNVLSEFVQGKVVHEMAIAHDLGSIQ